LGAEPWARRPERSRKTRVGSDPFRIASKARWSFMVGREGRVKTLAVFEELN
jgi:hypothetical protein